MEKVVKSSLFSFYMTDLYWKFLYGCAGFSIVWVYWMQHLGDLLHIFCAPVCAVIAIKGFIFTEPSEAFYAGVIMSIYSAILCAFPFFVYIFFLFFKPSLFVFESRSYGKKFVFFTLLLYTVQYFVLQFYVPVLWSFWVSFAITPTPELIQPTLILSPRIYPYVLIVMFCLTGAFFLVQLPIIVKWYTQSEQAGATIINNRSLWYLCFVLLAAFLSPPDLFIQLGVASFLWSFFEFWFLCTIIFTLYKTPEKKTII